MPFLFRCLTGRTGAVKVEEKLEFILAFVSGLKDVYVSGAQLFTFLYITDGLYSFIRISERVTYVLHTRVIKS